MNLRETAAKVILEKDIDETSNIRELIDAFEAYAHIVAEHYYRVGVSDTILNRINHDRIFPKNGTNLPETNPGPNPLLPE